MLLRLLTFSSAVLLLKTSFQFTNELAHCISLFHMKITASVAKSSHQICGPCYLTLPIFYLYIHPQLLLENKKLLRPLFSSAN